MTGGGATGAVGSRGALLLTSVKAMILHLLKNVKGLRYLMVFYLETLKISLSLRQL